MPGLPSPAELFDALAATYDQTGIDFSNLWGPACQHSSLPVPVSVRSTSAAGAAR